MRISPTGRRPLGSPLLGGRWQRRGALRLIRKARRYPSRRTLPRTLASGQRDAICSRFILLPYAKYSFVCLSMMHHLLYRSQFCHRGSVISPGPVAGKVFEQVFAHIFVLRPDEAEAEQKGAGRWEGGIFTDLCFPHECFLLVDGLCRDGESQGNICPYLTGVEGTLKAAPFPMYPGRTPNEGSGRSTGSCCSAHGCHRSLDTIPD